MYELEKFELIDGLPYYDGKVLKITKNSQGYCRVYINKKAVRLHRIIAEKYIPNPFNLPIVDHDDDNKDNNTIKNLQWLSYSQNSKKAYASKPSMKTMHEKQSRVIVAEKDGFITEHNSTRECARYLNRDPAAVQRVLDGEWNKCNGHTLKTRLLDGSSKQ